jgi:hypothetical protein
MSRFKLLGFAAQHFLLPALLRQLLGIVLLLLGQFLLTARQVGQLLHGVVDLLLLLLGLRSAAVGFVLVLVLIEFEIEQVGQIAARAATTAASPTTAAADLNLNIAEGRFGAQQMLQRLLFGRSASWNERPSACPKPASSPPRPLPFLSRTAGTPRRWHPAGGPWCGWPATAPDRAASPALRARYLPFSAAVAFALASPFS